MPNVTVAIYAPWVRAQNPTMFNGDPVLIKVNNLANRVAAAQAAFANHTPNNALLIFVAPEYYFLKPDPRQEVQVSRSQTGNVNVGALGVYKKGEKESILDLLRAETRKPAYANTLLVPGSIFWYDAMANKGYNSTPVIYQGNLLLLYNKRTDADSGILKTMTGNNLATLQLGQVSGIFQCGGLVLGIETCADHTNKVLKYEYFNQANPIANVPSPHQPKQLLEAQKTQQSQDAFIAARSKGGVDIHLIVSYGMDIQNKGILAHNNGYILCCDGDKRPQTKQNSHYFEVSVQKVLNNIPRDDAPNLYKQAVAPLIAINYNQDDMAFYNLAV